MTEFAEDELRQHLHPPRTRRRYSPELKAQVAITALASRFSYAEIAEHYGVPVSQVSQWRAQAKKAALAAFQPPKSKSTRGAKEWVEYFDHVEGDE